MQQGLMLGWQLVLGDSLVKEWMSEFTAEVIGGMVTSGEFQNCVLFQSYHN